MHLFDIVLYYRTYVLPASETWAISLQKMSTSLFDLLSLNTAIRPCVRRSPKPAISSAQKSLLPSTYWRQQAAYMGQHSPATRYGLWRRRTRWKSPKTHYKRFYIEH